MNRPIILSIALFPPIDYMALLLFHPGGVVIEAHENYQKQSYRNRYYIMGPNGKQLLQIPVSKGEDMHIRIMETKISDIINWRSIHLRSLLTAYNKSPWYMYYREDIEAFYRNSSSSLWSLALDSVTLASTLLGKSISPELTVEYLHHPESCHDLRDFFHPKRKPTYQKTLLPSQHYQQVFSFKFGFIPDLSILDLLFNEGPDSLIYLGKRYSSLTY